MTPLLGMLPSPPDPRDWDFAKSGLYGAAPRFKTIRTAPHVQRYQASNSCVGYTTESAVQDLNRKQLELGAAVRFLRLDGAGRFVLGPDGSAVVDDEPAPVVELPIMSGLWTYTGGRRMWFRLTGTPVPGELPDAGSSYRHNIMFARDVENGGGMRAEADWPETPANVSTSPSMLADQADPLVKVGGYHRIHGEGDPDVLRAGIVSALNGFERGECSKPMLSMMVTEGWANTPNGELYDDRNPGKDLGGHAFLGCEYDADLDAVTIENTWPGLERLKVRIEHMAKIGVGGESWVLQDLLYVPRRMAA